jgi:methylenetetrahydrofolate dehydrogenase (NADP+)/methenyltetrahydrofolate cyclohydrolase
VPRGGARLLQGGPIATEIRQAVSEDVAAYVERTGRRPILAVVICGRDAPSMVYLQQILRSCEKVGIEGRLVEVDGEASEAAVVDAIRDLNADAAVNGIIVQMPLPPSIRLRSVIDAIDPAKDIDGIHPLNAGLLRLGYDGFLPATAHAAVEILRRSGIEIEGKRAVVVGRSAVVGMPAAFLLVRENATVTVCHSRTRDLARHTKDAEILVVAAGRAGLITGDIVRRGVVVVDVGINVVDGTLVGDVDFESVRPKAAATPPGGGGVGRLTTALLLALLRRAARVQEDRAPAAAAAEPPAVPARAPSRRPSVSAGTVPDQPPVTTLRGAR